MQEELLANSNNARQILADTETVSEIFYPRGSFHVSLHGLPSSTDSNANVVWYLEELPRGLPDTSSLWIAVMPTQFTEVPGRSSINFQGNPNYKYRVRNRGTSPVNSGVSGYYAELYPI